MQTLQNQVPCSPLATFHILTKWLPPITFFSDIPAIDDGILGHGGSTMLQQFKPIMSSADITGLNIDPTTLKLPKFSPEDLMG
jgi:hypothetical protein